MYVYSSVYVWIWIFHLISKYTFSRSCALWARIFRMQCQGFGVSSAKNCRILGCCRCCCCSCSWNLQCHRKILHIDVLFEQMFRQALFEWNKRCFHFISHEFHSPCHSIYLIHSPSTYDCCDLLILRTSKEKETEK